MAWSTDRKRLRPLGPAHSRRMWKPPSTLIRSPVLNGKASVVSATTARATSSGVPQRRMGVRPFGDQLVVLLLDRRRHVAGDDAGTDLEDVDPVLGQPVGQQPGHHLHRGLGHAVVGPVRADRIGRNRRHVDDQALRDPAGRRWPRSSAGPPTEPGRTALSGWCRTPSPSFLRWPPAGRGGPAR